VARPAPIGYDLGRERMPRVNPAPASQATQGPTPLTPEQEDDLAAAADARLARELYENRTPEERAVARARYARQAASLAFGGRRRT
jgi:hypothetical protein